MNFKIFNELCKFILFTSKKYNIDSSHDITHSMDVLHYAHNIYKKEVYLNPGIKSHENIIYLASTLHDMCDKKYMDETENLQKIENFLTPHISKGETNAIYDIINTMSYSKVKKKGSLI